jgi:hypothetical protein
MDMPPPDDGVHNIAHIRVGGDIAGVLAVIGTVGVVLLGIPPLKWFMAAALACGAVFAFGLSAWHRRHPGPRQPPNSIAP